MLAARSAIAPSFNVRRRNVASLYLTHEKKSMQPTDKRFDADVVVVIVA